MHTRFFHTAFSALFPSRLRKPCVIGAQVILIALIWLGADYLSRHFWHRVPSSLMGLSLAFLFLAFGIVRREWLASGASWLIGEMLLFFVPAVIAIVQYGAMIRSNGLAILAVILISTVCVMVSTALAVDLVWRLQTRKSPAKEST